MGGGAWWAAVHGVAKSRTRLNDFFLFSLSCIGEGNGNPLQCSCLENPRDGEAWWLPSVGSHRVGHNWSDLALAAVIIHHAERHLMCFFKQSCGLYLPLDDFFIILALSLISTVKVKSLSRVQLFVTPWTVTYQTSQSMGFSRQENWSGLSFPSLGDLPDPGIEPGPPAL